MNIFAGNFSEKINTAVKKINDANVVNRIWNKDFTLWSSKPDEVVNRLGWLVSPDVTQKSVSEIIDFVNQIQKEGFTHALLMGMGGSSLAPEVFRLTFGVKEKFLDLSVIDTTEPSTILSFDNKLDPAKTLYIVSTKSGGTVETISFMKYFYNSVMKKLGKEKVSQHFIAITDPGSGLEQMAKDLKFRKIFLNDPEIGGRYSALSLFGIVPAALVGIDISTLLSTARTEADACKISGDKNKAALLGAALGVFADEGKDKVTFFCSKVIASFGGWVEQLVAESTGKIGKGILPVDIEELSGIDSYGNDRVFVFLRLKDDYSIDKIAGELKNSGHPVIEIILNDIYDLSREFFRWEFATAVASWFIKVQPFDQPNVEEAKIIARKMVKEYQENGKLPELIPSIDEPGMKVYGEVTVKEVKDVLSEFLDSVVSGKSYVAIQAYLPVDEKIFSSLQKLRIKILKKYKIATTVGFGPRFLHSTGQLHKGDSGNGYFIQLISASRNDAEIPDTAGEDSSTISFGVLIRAQALGDRQALLDNNRKVITIDINGDIEKKIEGLI